ncbi:single-stranded DNA-binding [Fusarium albosuccineum]|uniref:Single-stranded DNA-binding n=1 Tax=Fusarium albosuccineum TaxID=1237068 RepID=A0A8H4P9I1_9HYPO|nr:single-stranded DNA-binding [Fusarium albosuccineum]
MSFSLLRRAAVAPASAARAFSTTAPRPLARITIIGNLADSPELHSTSTGREIIRYAVASNSGPRDNRKTSWFRVTSFAEGPTRDYLMNLPKGATVYIEGDASTNTYTDSKGETRSGFSVVQRMSPKFPHSSPDSNTAQGNIEVLRRPQAPEQGE